MLEGRLAGMEMKLVTVNRNSNDIVAMFVSAVAAVVDDRVAAAAAGGLWAVIVVVKETMTKVVVCGVLCKCN